MWCGDLLKNMAGKLLGQHPLADTDELHTALTSLHRKVLRRTRGGAPAPRFVEIGHPNSQVDTTLSFHDLDLLQLPFSSLFRVATHENRIFCFPKFGNIRTVQFFGRVDVATLPEVVSENDNPRLVAFTLLKSCLFSPKISY